MSFFVESKERLSTITSSATMESMAPIRTESGGCDNDEIVTNPGKSGNVAMAKFTTCGDHDSIRIRLSEPIIGNGSFPATKIVFTDGVSKNVDGVFVGNYVNGADMTNTWIPLYR